MIFILFKIEAHSWKFEYFSNCDSIDRSFNRWLQRHFSDQSYALFYDHLQQLTTTQNRANLMRNFRRPKHPSAIEFQPAPETVENLTFTCSFRCCFAFFGSFISAVYSQFGATPAALFGSVWGIRFAKLSWDETSPPFFWGGLQNEKSTSRDRFEFPTADLDRVWAILIS